jgi:hypothetical protein
VRKILASLAAATALSAGAGSLVASQSQAAPTIVAPMTTPLQSLNENSLLQDVQVYYYAGHQYCWYFDGWHGPGWYWCGYQYYNNYGWGGPLGWSGWVVPGFVNRGGRWFYHGRPWVARVGGPGPGFRGPGPGFRGPGPGGRGPMGHPGGPGGHPGGPGGHPGGHPGGNRPFH